MPETDRIPAELVKLYRRLFRPSLDEVANDAAVRAHAEILVKELLLRNLQRSSKMLRRHFESLKRQRAKAKEKGVE